MLSEPQCDPNLVAIVIEGTGAKTGLLDLLAADLARFLRACLTLVS